VCLESKFEVDGENTNIVFADEIIGEVATGINGDTGILRHGVILEVVFIMSKSYQTVADI